MNARADPLVDRILVVDDNTAIHEDFRKVLRSDPPLGGVGRLEAELFGGHAPSGAAPRFELDCASQGTEALELVHQSMRVQTPYVAAWIRVSPSRGPS